MRRFTSIHAVTFEDVRALLQQWEDGVISDAEVYDFAEELYYLGTPDRPKYDRSDNRSVIQAVVELLDRLYTEPIFRSDAPILNRFLLLGETSPQEAWQFFDTWAGEVDWGQRDEEKQKRIDRQYGKQEKNS